MQILKRYSMRGWTYDYHYKMTKAINDSQLVLLNDNSKYYGIS